MKHLDLFSGIGGFALACQWNGIETIGFVEIDKYCQKVLRKHWPDVPIVGDIRDVEGIKEIVANATEQPQRKPHDSGSSQSYFRRTRLESPRSNTRYGHISITESREQSPAILVTAGFPCQPFSVAGKRGGEADNRYLWPETLAVIEEVKPEWVLLENVTGIINLALDTVLSDLEGAGYSWETLVIPACAVNAWHRRDRVWIVAYSGSLESRGVSNIKRPTGIEIRGSSQDVAISQSGESRQQTEPEGRQDSGRGSQEVAIANTTREGLQGQRTEHKLREVSTEEKTTGCSRWAIEPKLGRVAHGIPHRVDRLKCLGNAIVPQVAYEIIKVIKEIDERIPQ